LPALVDANSAAQNAFGKPASFSTLLAVWRDAIATGTVNGLLACGLVQIS
jgi:sulfite exporter TauE/SafE